MDKDFENKVVSCFIVKRKSERAIYELNNPKKRNTFLWSLPNFIDYQYSEELLQSIESDEKLYTILKDKGFSEECYVMAVDENLDSTFMSLREAISGVLGYGPALIVNDSADCAFLECEQDFGAPKRYILKK